jgi:hypothetical protein
MRSGEIVETLPVGEPFLGIDVIPVDEELVRLPLVRAMRALKLAVELR